MLFGLLTLVAGSALARAYMRAVAADEATVEAGTTYLLWFMPALALQFATQVMGSALRGDRHRAAEHAGAGACGDHQYRAGAGADHGLGHRPCARRRRCRSCELDRRPDRRADAVGYFLKFERYVAFRARAVAAAARGNGSASSMSACRPAASSRSSSSGWAWSITCCAISARRRRPDSASGTRVLGLIQMPALAVALAAGPIAGQNFGAGNAAACGKLS